ncbi:MAG: HAD hydrolase family protein [bacterium]|nr:HAD hydrolase family protein [bacterium]
MNTMQSVQTTIEKANAIRVVFSDVDGVFTDNRVLEGAPYKAKWRSYYDGQGVSLLRAIGIRVVLITNESGDSAKHITDVCAKWNALPSSLKQEGDGGWHHVKLYTGMGGHRKVEAVENFLQETGIAWEHCAYIGDDLVDATLMQKIAFRAAPISGDSAIKKMAHFVSDRAGGSGAFRDFANFILSCRGIDPLTLPPQ